MKPNVKYSACYDFITKTLLVAGFSLVFTLSSLAQHLYGGSFQRQAAETLAGQDFAYRFACTFYADEVGKNALPAELRFRVIRKRDNAVVREFMATRNSDAPPTTVTNECASQTTSPKTVYFSVLYTHESIINPIEFNDNEGYYVVNDAPPVPRKATSNVASPNLVLYHWFSSQYLFKHLDNADEGRAAFGINAPFSYMCRNQGKSLRLYMNVTPSVTTFNPDALDLTARVSVPLTNGTFPFQTVDWKNGFGLNNSISGDFFVNNSKPKFDNNAENSFFEAWTVPTQEGVFSMAYISEQRLNGVKMAENSLEMYAEVGECKTTASVSVYITETGSNKGASPYYCKDTPIQLNVNTAETGMDFQWYKEGQILQGETTKQLKVVGSGNYLLKSKKEGLCSESAISMKVTAIDCQVSGPPAILGNNMHDLINTTSQAKSGFMNEHSFRAVFYLPLADLPKMPKDLRGAIYRKRDNERMDAISFKQNMNAFETNTLERLCDGGMDSIQQVMYDASIEFAADRYNDPQGYYVTTEPVCCRADADNLSRKGSTVIPQLEIGPANQVKANSTINRGHTVDLFLPFTLRGCVGKLTRVFIYAGNRENITAKFGGFSELVSGNETSGGFREMGWASGFSAENFSGNKTKFTVDPRRNGIMVMTGTPEKPGVFVYRLRIDGMSDGKVYSSVYQEFRFEVDDCTPPPKPQVFVSIVGKPTIASTTELCQDSLVQLNLRNHRSWGKFQWYFNEKAVKNATDSVLIVSKNLSGQYKCDIKMARQCPETISTVPLKITFLDRPVVSIKFVKDYLCEGDKLLLQATASTAQTYEWQREGQLLDIKNTQLTVSEKGSYRVQISDNKGCIGVSNPVVVHQLTNPKAEIFSLNNAFCKGQSLTLTAKTDAEKPKYEWQIEVKPATGINDATFTATKAGNYGLKVTDSFGCASLSVTKKISEIPLPEAIITTPKSTVCEGTSLDLMANKETGYSYEWQQNGKIINEQNPLLKVSETGRYSVKITSFSNCVNNSNVVYIQQVKNPVVTLTAPQSRICQGVSVELTATAKNIIDYQWFKDGQPGLTEKSTLTVQQTGSYALSVTDTNGCMATSVPFRVEVVEPVKIFIDTIPAFCGYAFDEVALQGSPVGGVFMGKGVKNGYFSPRVAGLGLHTVTYTVKGNLECLSGFAEQKVQIKAAPNLSLGPEREIFRGTSTRLNADMGKGYSYLWNPPAWIDDARLAKPTINPDSTTYYKVLATSADNCASEDSVKIIVVQRVFMPDIFTPNGDGMNDTWQIIGIEAYPDIEVTVYNRWGNVVFYGKGSNQKPFDGTAQSEPLAVGVYVYVVRAKPGGHTDRGEVIIGR